MRTRVLSAMTALIALTASPAGAAELSLSGGTNSRGEPTLNPWTHPFGTGRVDTYVCPDGGAACDGPRPWVASESGGKTVDLGVPAPGTVFESRLVEGAAVTATARTPVWTGTLTNRTPPAVAGDPVVGGTVNVTPGGWEGGWAKPWDTWGADWLLACQDAAATTGCWYLADTQPLQLAARWTGYYLFGVSWRASSDAPVPIDRVAPPAPLGGPITPTPTNVLSAPAGPVRAIAAAEPLTQTAAAPVAPKVTLRARALRAKGRLSVGRVTCAVPCKVKLTVAGRSTTFTVRGTKALTIAPRHGRLKVKVVVDGKTLANGVVRAR